MEGKLRKKKGQVDRCLTNYPYPGKCNQKEESIKDKENTEM